MPAYVVTLLIAYCKSSKSVSGSERVNLNVLPQQLMLQDLFIVAFNGKEASVLRLFCWNVYN